MALAACVALTRGSNFQAGWFKWLACCSLPTLSPVEYGSGPLSRHGPRTLTRAHHDAARASPSVHPPDCQWTLVSAVATRLVPTEKLEPERQRARPGTDINRDLTPTPSPQGPRPSFMKARGTRRPPGGGAQCPTLAPSPRSRPCSRPLSSRPDQAPCWYFAETQDNESRNAARATPGARASACHSA
jgi:hypothetical protein